MNAPEVIAKLYLLPLTSVFFLVVAFLVERGDRKAHLRLAPFDVKILELELPLSNAAGMRLILVVLSVIPIVTLGFMDFSGFYPQHLRMEVFFDRRGLEESLKVFSPIELAQLNIPADYGREQAEYYRRLDQAAAGYLGESLIFGGHRNEIHSSGETSFVVRRLGRFQRYYIEEADGRLVHTLELPGRRALSFVSFFEKQHSRDDYLEPSIRKLILGMGYVIRPVFKQIIAESLRSEGQVFHHAVIGATKMWLYPFPTYSNTVYLADFGQAGLVPVGYAVYK